MFLKNQILVFSLVFINLTTASFSEEVISKSYNQNDVKEKLISFSNLENLSKSFKNIPEVNLKANTPINAPKIISMYWSLIATAVVMLSMEKAKSVIERRATTLRNLNLF